MKVSREQAAANRERIVEVASKLFRENGFDGIGIADLMKAAGLTHGGFYGHFESKDELAAEACGRAMARASEKWAERCKAQAGACGHSADGRSDGAGAGRRRPNAREGDP
jgi:TetR/AcrR family transcriptional repressor of nem operon